MKLADRERNGSRWRLNVTGPFIATSTGELTGSADQLTHLRNECENPRGGLQQRGAQSAHRTVQSVSGSFAAKGDNWPHERANELAEHAVEHGVDGIVVDDLDRIRDAMSDEKTFQ